MTRKFSVGQRVRIVRSTNPKFIGRIATIVRGPVTHAPDGVPWEGGIAYELDFPSAAHPGPYGASPHSIEPVDDGHELGSWDALTEIWRPMGVRA